MNPYKCKQIVFAYLTTPLVDIEAILDKEIEMDKLSKKSVGIYPVDSVFDSSDVYRPQVYNANPTKALFFDCYSTKGTIMISNISDGWNTLCHILSSSTAGHVYMFQFDDPREESHLSCFSCIKNGEDVRIVYAIKDPRWKFFQKGEILSFENNDYYQRRVISSRVNRDILSEYCHFLHLEVEKDEFWEVKNKSILFEYRW
ncbi:hypothetical protein AGMMS49545_23570 [Betaproteobacteria bacterium]|nr:hypothetical protein AGMMS49545_23570 [Betaproteobacteria bacterium]GHU48774.1 hypothetical protein AGMMS50289_25700 [Betaproteobacteria bacterium]